MRPSTLVMLASIMFLGTPEVGRADSIFTVDGKRGVGGGALPLLDTGLFFDVGAALVVSATGLVGWTNGSQNLVDPDGGPGCSPAGGSFWLPSACRTSLVGMIGGVVFALGSSFNGPAPDAGFLLLGVNDNNYNDNEGSFTVTVIPEPSTSVLFGGAVLALAALRRPRRNQGKATPSAP